MALYAWINLKKLKALKHRRPSSVGRASLS
jgi:hypothetical protein